MEMVYQFPITDFEGKYFNLIENKDINESIRTHLDCNEPYRLSILKENFMDHVFLYEIYRKIVKALKMNFE